ncbi:MAG: FAD-binding protein, partial [Anaerolineae bacterium]|nr:FAD-binding protein [Anaerolineae bacterium]
IVEINPERREAIVEPGVVLNTFNAKAAEYGLKFGPDPASADRATFGGMMGNNSTGAHSIEFGMTADHVLQLEAVMADGSLAQFESIEIGEMERRAQMGSLEGAFYRSAVDIRREYRGAIQAKWPQTWRRASGYSLNYLLPWSASQPPRWMMEKGDAGERRYPPQLTGQINLAPVLVGSEGTLAVFRRARVKLVPLAEQTILGVLSYDSVAEACDATPEIMQLNPSAVELIPQALIRRARSVPAYARRLSFVRGDPAALLVVEFSGKDAELLRKQVVRLGQDVVIAESAAEQEQIWAVRKVGLGLLMSRAGDTKPLPFVEDVAVPVERLGEFVREIERIMERHGTQGDFYAHASAGCLHIRPLVNLKSEKGQVNLRGITQAVVALTTRLGGALSGEHGDGLARSEWLEEIYGSEITTAFRMLKHAADPKGLLNPGKIVDPPSMNENLRYTPEYRSKTWEPVLDFASQGDLAGAVEMCNGAGVCRKVGGVMCPSFKATQDEMHSTRGRANLLRMMISGQAVDTRHAEAAAFEALDLCLECKGCKAECPSAVDMAKLKYEFLNQYYDHHRRPVRDYLFAYIGTLARLGRPLAGLVNFGMSLGFTAWVGEHMLGIASQRKMPKLQRAAYISGVDVDHEGSEAVILLVDAFSEYFYPEIKAAALTILKSLGCEVNVLPVIGAGRTFISKGFLRAAKRHAAQVKEAIKRLDPEGRMAIVGVEPSEIITLQDEYKDLFPGDAIVAAQAERSLMLDEFLVRENKAGMLRIDILRDARGVEGREKTVLVHGHCYQKTQPPAADGFAYGVGATLEMLSGLGYKAELIEAGCCGMAGSFGYESGHYDLSMQIGEMDVFPAVRKAGDDVLVAAAGVSCRAQIDSGTGRRTEHPIMLAAGKL